MVQDPAICVAGEIFRDEHVVLLRALAFERVTAVRQILPHVTKKRKPDYKAEQVLACDVETHVTPSLSELPLSTSSNSPAQL